jgi:hypothetical protein
MDIAGAGKATRLLSGLGDGHDREDENWRITNTGDWRR